MKIKITAQQLIRYKKVVEVDELTYAKWKSGELSDIDMAEYYIITNNIHDSDDFDNIVIEELNPNLRQKNERRK